MAADAVFTVASGVFEDDASTDPAEAADGVANWAGTGGYTATQTTAGNRPTYRTSGGPNNGAYIEFDGTNDRLVLSWNVDPVAGFVLCRPDATGTTYRTVLGADKSGGTYGSYYYGFQNDRTCTAHRVTGAGANDLQATSQGWRDVWQILGWRISGSTIYLYKNGTLVGSDTYTPGSLGAVVSGSTRLGAGWYGGVEVDFFDGGIAEVQLWASDPGESAFQAAALQCLTDHGIGYPATQRYFFPTFHGTDEQFYMLVSDDGISWVNRAAHFTAASVRDASVYDDGAGTWWMVYTSGAFTNHDSFGVAKSLDAGYTWTHVADVTISAATGGTAPRVWAPDFVRNADNTIYLSGGYPVVIVSVTTDWNAGAGTFTYYAVSPTNAAFTSWGTPVAVTGTSLPNSIDMTVFVRAGGGTFDAWVKQDPSGPNLGNLQRWKSTTSLTAGWAVQDGGAAPTGFGTGVEGPSWIRVGAVLRVYFDAPGTALYYSDADGTDPDSVTWGTRAAVTHPFQNSMTPRHGSIMAPIAGGTAALPLVNGGLVNGGLINGGLVA